MTRCLVLAGLAMLVTPLAADQEPGAQHATVAEQLVAAINAGDDAGVQRLFNAIMAKAFPPEKAGPFFRGLVAQYGKIVKVDAPRMSQPPAALMRLHFERGKFLS